MPYQSKFKNTGLIGGKMLLHTEPDWKIWAQEVVFFLMGGFMVAQGRAPRQKRECESRPDSCSWLYGLMSRPGSAPQSPWQTEIVKSNKTRDLSPGGEVQGALLALTPARWHSEVKARAAGGWCETSLVSERSVGQCHCINCSIAK